MHDLPRRWLLPTSLIACVAVWMHVTAAQTAPSREPMLRIEAGMHTAAIRSIAVDRSGRFLVTGSIDKTVRVWELPDGRLLHVLRVPIGPNEQGRIDAVAIAPDGRTITAGGWTSPDGLHESIYVFDRESGRLLRRLPDLAVGVTHLAFSKDGARLVATFHGRGGIRVWRTSDWSDAGRDTAYGDEVYGADFDPDGRLVTVSVDGSMRLYDRGLHLLTKRQTSSGKSATSVSFSPDGRRIAVGFSDINSVEVVSGEALAPLFIADTRGLNRFCRLYNVAWSTDGSMVYAGGTCGERDERLIRRWGNAGQGAAVDTFVSQSPIAGIVPLASGGVAYGAGDPTWGIVDPLHAAAHQQPSPIPDYHEMTLRSRANAGAITFGYKLYGEAPAAFYLTERALIGGDREGAIRDVASGFFDDGRCRGIRTGEYFACLELAKSLPLKLAVNERITSVAFVRDESRVLLGTSFGLHFFTRNGDELWRVVAPGAGAALAVNLTADGRWALAALGDGTIRWYRLADGTELLALFPHADRKRWVLWTPSGYYDASPGAEDLIGWHVNNGADQLADFFPASRFRGTYYRPDVVARVLETGDESDALQLANAVAGRGATTTVARQLPPVVEILSPSDRAEVSTTAVNVRFTVRLPSGEPVTTIRALVDGRPAPGVLQRVEDNGAANGVRELRVTVPERDSEIAIIAENRYTASVPGTVRLSWRGVTPRGLGAPRADRAVVQPKLYVLAVGISRYANAQFNLGYAAKDAGDFVAAMLAQKNLLYRDVVVYRGAAVTDAAATKDEILGGFDWIRKETTSNDVAMVFLAGHGFNDQSNNYFFYPHNIDADSLLRTGVAFTDIKAAVSSIAGKALFFVDTCHSGNAIGLAARRGGVDINIVINELSSAQNGAVVFSASTGSESSYEREDWNNGAFTKALVEGVNGAAAAGDTGRITYNMLNLYVSEQVKALTKGQQHPTMISPQTVPDFPIAVKKPG